MKREKQQPKTLDTGGSVPSHPGFRKKKMTTTSLRDFLYWRRMTRKISQSFGCAVSREARSAHAQTRNRSGGYLVHEALARVTARVGATGPLSGRKSCEKAARARRDCAHTRCQRARGATRPALPCGLEPPIGTHGSSPRKKARTFTFAPKETESPKKVRARLPFRQRRETTDTACDEKDIYEKKGHNYEKPKTMEKSRLTRSGNSDGRRAIQVRKH